jgi:hypothetical protein
MAKKRRKTSAKPRSSAAPPQFASGATVRVRPGVFSSHYSDIPMGGWSGTVEPVRRRAGMPMYLVHWNDHTLAQMRLR